MKRLLLVDDDPRNIRILELIFRHDYALCVAQNGAEALEQIATFKPHAILLDIMMEGIDGYTVLRQVKTNPQTAHTIVIVVSSRAMPAELQRGLDSGADDYFTKPFDHDLLRERLAARLASNASPAIENGAE